ncbi:beta-ACP synthase [Amylibacter marinus]|uniref:Nodulation protein E n=1 Tax=Amylibacter marinus TaxID=1475483 RepID=A0ABQ5VSN1_9RHOB|nr:beta-ketoacyl-[acyl-carrier-protein] synthase family protein [Amylibacter marinus]GLQ34437.1 beta-ACP synthase [Amylibacter marinus]
MKRVVITGQGTVNALGMDVASTLNAMAAGTSGISNLDFENVDRLNIKIGGQIHGFDPDAHFTRQKRGLYDRFTEFGLLAADQAIAQSGLVFEGELAERTGVVMGTAGGGLQTQDENYRAVYEQGKNRVHPFVVPRLMNNAAASHISMVHNLMGPSFAVATACASSNHAMGQAVNLVRAGASPVMIAGGSESMLCFGGIKAWEGLRVMSGDGCRPFCATRNGMVQGEGAAVFVFEEYEHARARGAEILCEISGFAMTSDAGDIVTPNADGAQRAMRQALKNAKLNPDDVGYVNAHGTGTTLNDSVETTAIKRVFGDHAHQLMISSTKSMHGHLIGGTGAVELLACIAALTTGMIAPTIGFTTPDPACDLDYVPNTARDKKIGAAISNAFAFGGLNAVIALRAI